MLAMSLAFAVVTAVLAYAGFRASRRLGISARPLWDHGPGPYAHS